MPDAASWAAGHAAALEGQDAQAAVALVRDAGLHPRIAGPDSVVTLEFRPDRITLRTDEDGVVTAARPG